MNRAEVMVGGSVAASLLPNELRAHRHALKLTQAELAAALGVTATTVARWERGERPVSSAGSVRLALQRLRGEHKSTPEVTTTLYAPRSSDRGVVTSTYSIPNPISTFIGREREVALVKQLLEANRLVTLTGAGGVGKTRLALRVVADLLERFSDGIVFVPLAPITDPALVPSTIAQLVGLQAAVGRELVEVLQEALRGRQLLLVLDNFEQLLSAAPLVTTLLSSCAQLKVLATSRAMLHLSGEHTFAVPPLELPERQPPEPLERLSQYEAVRLFIERAQAIKNEFQISADTADAVAEICRRLDGLPLAIELAAARILVLPPAAILARLEHRLDLLIDGPSDEPERHRTLRAAIGWSYDLLNERDQGVFRRLGAFVGGCTLQAADAVCSQDTDTLHRSSKSGDQMLGALISLVEQGLVHADNPTHNEPRFGLLETIREYALERMIANGEKLATRARHAAYFLRLAEGLGSDERIWGPDGRAYLDRLEQEHDNLRAALRWAIDDGGSETAFRLAEALWRMWLTHGHLSEARRWLEEVLALPDGREPTSSRALLMQAAAMHAYRQGDLVTATAYADEGLAIGRELNDRFVVAMTLNMRGLPKVAQGEYGEARGAFQDSLLVFRQLKCHPLREAMCLHNLALAACHEEDYATAQAAGSEALATARELGSIYMIPAALTIAGVAAQGQGDHAAARALLEEGLALAQQVDVRWITGECLEGLGHLAAQEGNHRESRARFVGGLETHRNMGDHLGIARCLEGLARTDAAAGRPQEALQLAGAAAAQRDRLSAPRSPRSQHLLDTWLGPVQHALGQTGTEQAWAAGRRLSMDQAVALALAVVAPAVAPFAKRAEPAWRPSAAALTNRETDVLRLIAGGQSNREIAAELVLSIRTVERHITTLYGKIDARGRADATAYALRHALI